MVAKRVTHLGVIVCNVKHFSAVIGKTEMQVL